MLLQQKFPERLKNLRQRNGITLEKLGVTVGVSKQSAQRWEVGISVPSAEKLIALADFFDVSLNYLAGRSDDPKRY